MMALYPQESGSKKHLLFIILIFSLGLNVAHGKEDRAFIVYPKDIKSPKNRGIFSLKPIEVDNLYGHFEYLEAPGYSIVQWPQIQKPETILDLIISSASFEYLNNNYLSSINILNEAIDKNLYGKSSKNNHIKRINELQRRKALAKLRYRIHYFDSDPMVILFNYRQNRVVKNESSHFLGNLLNQKKYYVDAISVLKSARPPFEENFAISQYSALLKSYIETGNYHRAIKLFDDVPRSINSNLLLNYNLGIAYLKKGDYEKGIDILENIGEHTILPESEENMVIRDRANLSLAIYFTEGERQDLALNYYKNIRSEGPYSHQALLGFGWAHFARKDYKQAIAPWQILQTKSKNDYFSKEALMSLPYGYSHLNQFNRSARLYDSALFEYFSYIDEIDDVISFVESDNFIIYLNNNEWKEGSHHQRRFSEHNNSINALERLGLFADGIFINVVESYIDINQLLDDAANQKRRIDGLISHVNNVRKFYTLPIASMDKQYSKIRASYDTLFRHYTKLISEDRETKNEFEKMSSNDQDLYEELTNLEKELNEITGGSVSMKIGKRIKFVKNYLMSRHLFFEIIEEPDDSDFDELYEHMLVLHKELVSLVDHYAEFNRIFSPTYFNQLTKKQDEILDLEKRLNIQLDRNKEKILQLSKSVLIEDRKRISNYIAIVNNELRKSIVKSKNQLLIAESKKIVNERKAEAKEKERADRIAREEQQKKNNLKAEKDTLEQREVAESDEMTEEKTDESEKANEDQENVQ